MRGGVKFRLETALIVLLVVAAACGGGDGEAPKARQIFRFGTELGTTTFDASKSNDTPNDVWYLPVYERLTSLAADGSLEPQLATSWEFSTDGKTLTFKLRQGVTFHDETRFDAAAVKANIERTKEPEAPNASALKSIDSVEVVDDSTVAFRLSKPDTALPRILSGLAGIMIGPRAHQDPNLFRSPVGTGPYRIVSYEPEAKAVYEPYANYWGPKEKLIRLEIHLIKDPAARLNALLTGQIDAALLPFTEAQRAEREGFRVTSGNTTRIIYFQPDKAEPPFNNEKARQAVNLAINREALVQALYEGRGTPIAQHWPPGWPGHNPDLKPVYDPDRARELLREAGFAEGFEFQVFTPGEEGFLEAQAVQGQLREFGIRMKVTQMDINQIVDRVFVRGEGNGFWGLHAGRADPIEQVNLFFAKDGFLNVGHVGSDRIDPLVEKAAVTTDESERLELFQEIAQAVYDEAAVIYVVLPQLHLVTATKVRGLTFHITGRPDYRGVTIKG